MTEQDEGLLTPEEEKIKREINHALTMGIPSDPVRKVFTKDIFELFKAQHQKDEQKIEEARGDGRKEVVEWAIAERNTLKIKKSIQASIKPQDIQGQINIGAKMKALQQVIDKFNPKGGSK